MRSLTVFWFLFWCLFAFKFKSLASQAKDHWTEGCATSKTVKWQWSGTFNLRKLHHFGTPNGMEQSLVLSIQGINRAAHWRVGGEVVSVSGWSLLVACQTSFFLTFTGTWCYLCLFVHWLAGQQHPLPLMTRDIGGGGRVTAKLGWWYCGGMGEDLERAREWKSNAGVSFLRDFVDFRETHIRSTKKTCRFIHKPCQKVLFWLQIAPNWFLG